jgi:hypothetical protein
MIPGSANPLLLASAASAAGYNIERSLRFNSADSAYLSRTPSVAGNRKTWTYAFWAKLSYGNTDYFLRNVKSGNSDSGYILFSLSSLGDIRVSGWATNWLQTTAVFRDPSAWYHILLAADTTQATASNRLKLFVNGTQIATFTVANYPTQNLDLPINATGEHDIGVSADFYLADVHLIDGQALDPTSFGEFDANGVWQPKAYTGSYPGNSFHLDFADNSAATTAGIGKDVSGNGNDWTPVNLSVAAGAGNDSLVDTPTSYGTDTGAGGEVRGNYATLNPLDITSGMTLSNGNLEVAQLAGADKGAYGTIGVSSGKWYWEVQCTAGVGSMVGIADLGKALAQREYPDTAGGGLYYYQATGGLYGYLGGSFTNTPYGAAFASPSDVVGIALDMDNGNVNFYKNGVDQGVANTSSLLGKTVVAAIGNGGATASNVFNFGQRQWAYAAPAGFKALCTTNLPEPQTITTSGTYTGNGVADGPFVYLNGVPTAMTVNGNAVTFGTHADKLGNGFKVRTTSTTYNQNAVVYNYSITSTGDPFKVARAQSNP